MQSVAVSLQQAAPTNHHHVGADVGQAAVRPAIAVKLSAANTVQDIRLQECPAERVWFLFRIVRLRIASCHDSKTVGAIDIGKRLRIRVVRDCF